MRLGDRVRAKDLQNSDKYHLERHLGTYIRRDMRRFMPFLVRFDTGEEAWLAACFLEVVRPAKARVH